MAGQERLRQGSSRPRWPREERLNHTASASAATQAAARLYQWPSVLLTLTAIFWAGNAVAGRLAVGQIQPMQLVCLRWVMVLAVMWWLYGGQVRAHWGEVRPQLGRIVVVGFLGLTAFNALFYVAAHTTTAVNIGILQGSVPVIVLAGAFLTYGTKATLVQIAGVLITAMGVVVVATHGQPWSILNIEFNRGDLLMLAACVLYAVYTVALRDRPRMPGAAFFTLLALISAVTSLPLAVAEALVSGLVVPDLAGLAGDPLRGDLPVHPRPALLRAGCRPDRTWAHGRVRQPGADLRRHPRRGADRRAVRRLPRRRSGSGARRHMARPANWLRWCQTL